jgi:hypothetical protein
VSESPRINANAAKCFDAGYQLRFGIELAVSACCCVQRADFTGFTDLMSVLILHVFTLLSLMYPIVVFFFLVESTTTYQILLIICLVTGKRWACAG